MRPGRALPLFVLNTKEHQLWQPELGMGCYATPMLMMSSGLLGASGYLAT